MNEMAVSCRKVGTVCLAVFFMIDNGKILIVNVVRMLWYRQYYRIMKNKELRSFQIESLSEIW